MNKYGIKVNESATANINHFFHIDVPGLNMNTNIEAASKTKAKNP